MPAQISMVFPSFIYQGALNRAGSLNRELAREIHILSEIDDAGVKWSKANYVGGYSSYSSQDRLHLTSPTFAELEKLLRPHMRRFARKLGFDLTGRRLEMTTCWANLMGQGTHHTMHTHPNCVLSGVYYVTIPPQSSPFKIEDPRLGLMMAAPPRKTTAPNNQQNYMLLSPKPSGFVMFESWMRHEVPPHRAKAPRLSISFNYEV